METRDEAAPLWLPRVWPAAACLVLLVVTALALLPKDGLWDRTVPAGTTWGEVLRVDVAGDTWEFRPYRLDSHGPGDLCVAHQTGENSGARCFVAGTTVETYRFEDEDQTVLFGVTVREAATVRVPVEGADRPLEATVEDVLGVGAFTLVLDEERGGAILGNETRAYGADGVRLVDDRS